MSILEDERVSLEVKIHNINQPTLFLNVEREANPEEKIQIMIKSEEMESSFVEVFDGSHRSFLEENRRFYFKQSKELNKTSLELIDFILEGKNILEIIIVSEETSSNKNVRIVTDIYKYSNEIKVTENQFTINP